jgi:hypothetical protein
MKRGILLSFFVILVLITTGYQVNANSLLKQQIEMSVKKKYGIDLQIGELVKVIPINNSQVVYNYDSTISGIPTTTFIAFDTVKKKALSYVFYEPQDMNLYESFKQMTLRQQQELLIKQFATYTSTSLGPIKDFNRGE